MLDNKIFEHSIITNCCTSNKTLSSARLRFIYQYYTILHNILRILLSAGTRIVYERAFLMQCRNSPLAKSPPANMLRIPGVTSPVLSELVRENGDAIHIHEERDKDGNINFFERN